MKTIITLVLVLFIGVAVQAQNNTNEAKVATIEMSVVTINADKEFSLEKVATENKVEVARLYKFKNSRIKKALAFTTKRNKAKMA